MYLKIVHKTAMNVYSSSRLMFNVHYKENSSIFNHYLIFCLIFSKFSKFWRTCLSGHSNGFGSIKSDSETNKQINNKKNTKKAKQLQLINKKKDVICLQMQGNLYKQPQKYLISRSQDCFFCPAAFCQLQPYIYAHKLYRTTRELYGT